MPRTPQVSQPRHRAPIIRPRTIPEIAATDKSLDEAARGEYAGTDTAVRFLAMCRDEVLGASPGRQPRQRGPWHELYTTLAAGAFMLTLAGVAVILVASAAAGIVMLAWAASSAATAWIIMRIAGRPR